MAVTAAAPVDPAYRKKVLRVIFVSLLLDLVWPASFNTCIHKVLTLGTYI